MKSTEASLPTSRETLATAQSRERGGQVDRGVLLRRRRADKCHDLLRREDIDVAALRGRRLLDFGGGIPRQPVDLAGSLENPMHEDKRLRSSRGRSVNPGDPCLDHRSGDRLDRQLAKGEEEL